MNLLENINNWAKLRNVYLSKELHIRAVLRKSRTMYDDHHIKLKFIIYKGENIFFERSQNIELKPGFDIEEEEKRFLNYLNNEMALKGLFYKCP